MTVGTGTNSGTLQSAPASRLVLNNNSTSASTINSVISDGSGASSLTKAGTGTFTLTGANTYTGATTIAAGTLTLSGGAAIADTGAVSLVNVAGAALELNNSETIGSLSGGGRFGGNVSLGANVLTVGDGTSNTFAGVVSGTGSITKVGSGTQTLSGANAYTGSTVVSTGTLRAGIATVGGLVPASGAFGINSPVTLNGGATLDLNGFNETLGSLSDNAGSGGTVTSGTTGAITLSVGVDNTSKSFAGTIQNGSGTVAVTKAGAGTWTLGGASTYTGGTTVAAGALIVVNIGGSATGSGPVTVASGATLGGVEIPSAPSPSPPAASSTAPASPVRARCRPWASA